MDAALQRRIQRYGWDKAANYYEASWRGQLLPAQQKLLAIADIRSGERVIDIACGTGLVTFEAAGKAGTNGFVAGNDISDKMVEQARRAAEERQIGNVLFERMDGEDLHVAGGAYDVALCALGLMYFPDPHKALKEMHRVLRKGGRAAVAVWGERSHCGWASIFDIVDRRVTSEVCPMFFHLGNTEVLKNSLSIAGFEDLRLERMKTWLEYASGEEACVASFAGGPVALPYHKFSMEIKEEVHAEYLASIAQFRNGDGYLVPGEFVIAVGEK